MKPIIGVVARPDITSGGNLSFYIHKQVSDVIIQSGGIPLIIVPTQLENYYGHDIKTTEKMDDLEFSDLKIIIDKCNGLICQGGDEFYDYDVQIVKYAHQMDIPILGICLGMQTMSYLFGSEIRKLDNSNHHKKNVLYVHDVFIEKKSKLYDILKQDHIKVNSRHYSYVDFTKLDIVGISDDHIIEAIEDKNKIFFLGLQWHPESLYAYDILMNRLFAYFINICK